ncbi:hypothetical protein FHL15_000307 [Xylaria flabelliformis]|uniref:Uncharacterized protein n=1 Tax=Xylaria flabelliformis TaxID=2512241 RepID=A0A553IFI7_9PEZI|nr:hypothetical protein FHL15_000307 [Xylaria flabelliformis]
MYCIYCYEFASHTLECNLHLEKYLDYGSETSESIIGSSSSVTFSRSTNSSGEKDVEIKTDEKYTNDDKKNKERRNDKKRSFTASNRYDPSFLINKSDREAKDRNGRTPLHLAALNGHLAVAEALVQAGAALTAKERDERMPSRLAMEQGNSNLLEFLVNNGDVDARDRDGSKQKTQHLKYQGAYGTVQRPAAEALLSLQADPDAVDRDLRTPLHVETIRGAPMSETIIQTLIKGGASVDKKDRDGRTALHLAALGGTRVLPSRDRDGHAPLHLAAKNGHLQIAMFLVETSADIRVTEPRREYSAAPDGVGGVLGRGQVLGAEWGHTFCSKPR